MTRSNHPSRPRLWPIVAVSVLAVVSCTIEAPAENAGTGSANAPTTLAEPERTGSQDNAARLAKTYVVSINFSRQGLIDQLEFEGFTTADAEFAVDTLDVDWNQQAVESAETYVESQGFSCAGLIDQLEFEGFTTKQAEFGAGQTSACE